MTGLLLQLLDGLLLVAFYAALFGLCLFAVVLGSRIRQAHHRGLDRVRNHHTRETAR